MGNLLVAREGAINTLWVGKVEKNCGQLFLEKMGEGSLQVNNNSKNKFFL